MYTSTEQHRRECEARYWLQHEQYDTERIKARLKQIRKKRGARGEETLAAEMRKQWRLQRG